MIESRGITVRNIVLDVYIVDVLYTQITLLHFIVKLFILLNFSGLRICWGPLEHYIRGQQRKNQHDTCLGQ